MTAIQLIGQLLHIRDKGESGEGGAEDVQFLKYCLKHVAQSKSQLFQDLWVGFESRAKSDGFFVEFGAASGVGLSNTHFLEKQLGWKGILAEPGRGYYPAIREARDCVVDDRCVWTKSGEELTFNQTGWAELSTIDAYSYLDKHSDWRKDGVRYPVQTISLNDLLDEWDAPAQIDYMSIDTEGSEYDILSNFDFGPREINMFSIEHNYTGTREKIADLLAPLGYERKFPELSQWDDWYIKST